MRYQQINHAVFLDEEAAKHEECHTYIKQDRDSWRSLGNTIEFPGWALVVISFLNEGGAIGLVKDMDEVLAEDAKP